MSNKEDQQKDSAQPVVAEEQQQEETPVSPTDAQATPAGGEEGNTSPPKKRKKGRLVDADEVMPRPSIWPLALAFSLVVLLLGVAIHPIVIGVGALLVIAVVVGWITERR